MAARSGGGQNSFLVPVRSSPATRIVRCSTLANVPPEGPPVMERAPRLVSIVVPTYNERQNLPRLVAAIAENVPWPYEIVVVDDSSPDGTADLARDLAKAHPVRL